MFNNNAMFVALTKRNSTQFIMIYRTLCFEMLCCLFVRVRNQTNLCFFGLNGRIDSFHRGRLLRAKTHFICLIKSHGIGRNLCTDTRRCGNLIYSKYIITG